MSIVWIVSIVALAGSHVEASAEALQRWLGPGQPPEALERALTEARLATASPQERDDPDTWVHAARVYGLAVGSGDAALVEPFVDAVRRAVELGAPKDRLIPELQKVSLKLVRRSVNATVEAQRKDDPSARTVAYAWAKKAWALDRVAEELGAEAGEQRASTLTVLAKAAHEAGRIEEALAYYEELRASGHRDVGLARSLALHKARTDVDEAVEWLQADLREGRELDLVAVQAEILLDAGYPERAVRSIEPHMAVFEDRPEAWALLGRAQEARGDVEAARTSLDRCLALEPRSVVCLWGRGGIPYRQGRAVTLVEAEKRGKRSRNEGFQAKKRLYQEALRYLEPAHEVEPDNLEINAALLAIYTELGAKAKLEALSR